MLILGIDTAGTNCSCALVNEQKTLAEFNLNVGLQHSVLLMPLIEELFEKSGKSPKDLSALAINKGPGSFTGLRIGLSVAEAMAYALNLPLYSYPTFQVTRQPYETLPMPTLVLQDALKQTYYSAAYWGPEEFLAPQVRTLEELHQALGHMPDLLVLGDAMEKSLSSLKEIFPQGSFGPASAMNSAAACARLCLADLIAGIEPDPDTTPSYMRQPQAVREYEAKHGRKMDL